MAVGMTFVILTGGVDLSVGGVTACVGVICAKLMVGGWHPVLAILVALAFAGLVKITKVIPTAIIPTMETCLNTLIKFDAEKKYCDANEKKIISNSNTK